jgi:hypothetical protein
MTPMQQPVAQYVPVGHIASLVHIGSPDGHAVEPLQLAGRSLGSCPGHRIQLVPPHCEVPHVVLFVHVLHFVGSLSVAVPHSGEVVGLMMMS